MNTNELLELLDAFIRVNEYVCQRQSEHFEHENVENSELKQMIDNLNKYTEDIFVSVRPRPSV